MRSAEHCYVIIALAAAIAAAPAHARASEHRRPPGPTEQRVADAEAAFERGKQCFDAGRTDEACVAFEAAERLDPSVGSLGLLAACHERQGRIATAWKEYVETAVRARANGDDRADFAEERARTLAATLPKLAVRVAAWAPGLEVARAGTPVARSDLAAPLPIDPGEIEVVARAPGMQTWRTVVYVAPGSETTVDVPRLAPMPVREAPAARAPDRTRTTVGVVATSAGIVTLGIGAGFAVDAVSKRSDADRYCDPSNQCEEPGGRLLDRAKTSAAIASVGIGVGLVSTITGVTLLLTSKPSAPRTAHTTIRPTIGQSGAGATVGGVF